ncbi:hypothetical protein A9Q89_05390 [Gammaproteobacteria bacterium 53_120_T64]|nr:hypothetical protein A9Q89_05390 [Gammaproteobacteria bacterium 53_120_T64]
MAVVVEHLVGGVRDAIGDVYAREYRAEVASSLHVNADQDVFFRDVKSEIISFRPAVVVGSGGVKVHVIIFYHGFFPLVGKCSFANSNSVLLVLLSLVIADINISHALIINRMVVAGSRGKRVFIVFTRRIRAFLSLCLALLAINILVIKDYICCPVIGEMRE